MNAVLVLTEVSVAFVRKTVTIYRIKYEDWPDQDQMAPQCQANQSFLLEWL